MLDDSIGPGFVGTDHSSVPFPISSADSLPSNVETNSNLKLKFLHFYKSFRNDIIMDMKGV